ncbi:MAG: ABC transporter permease [Bacteroidetes bacterium]|nr:ABC transporter permease [Bacteroidota bacterium]
MRKLWCILNKEFLLLVRDIPGLIILFLMPVLLIFVVTLAQENALKSQNSTTRILFVDELKSPFSIKLLANLDSSGFFQPVADINALPVNEKQAKDLIGDGDYKFGIIIPRNDTAIILLIDPTLQETYKKTVTNTLTYIIKGTQTNEAMEGILASLPHNMQPAIRGMVAETMQKLPPVRESYAIREKSDIQPNVIQNNVPGFILFAMFFIVIPLAGSLITEKNEGSFQRLRSLPVRLSAILGGKVIAYLVVCLLQFTLMMWIGTSVFPVFFGFPPLQLGHQYMAIIIVTIAASLAAIGFGIIVGAAANTHNQAAMFGSVMVVLLGIVSGTFLPIHIMPKFFQFISHGSPMRWGIDNYLNLFIREGNIASILPNTILLISFFGFAMIASIAIFAKQK